MERLAAAVAVVAAGGGVVAAAAAADGGVDDDVDGGERNADGGSGGAGGEDASLERVRPARTWSPMSRPSGTRRLPRLENRPSLANENDLR